MTVEPGGRVAIVGGINRRDLPRNVIKLTDATGDARLTALIINQFLNGEKIIPVRQKELIHAKNLSKKFFEKCHHCDLPAPMHEHLRCINCGTCRDCKTCLNSCPEKAIMRVENPDGTWQYISEEKNVSTLQSDLKL